MRLGRSQLWCNIHWTACEHGKMNNNNGRSHDDDVVVDLYVLKFSFFFADNDFTWLEPKKKFESCKLLLFSN